MVEEATNNEEIIQEVIDPVVSEAEENTESATVITGEEVTPEEQTELSIEDIVSGTKKPKNKVQGRIDELTGEKYELRKEVEFWKEKAEKKEVPVMQTTRPLPPSPLEYSDLGEYREAVVQYEDRLDVWKGQQRDSATFIERQRQEFAEVTAKFTERAKKMREQYADFDTAINEPVFSPTMSMEIMTSEYGPEIGYYLAKNPSEALKLSKLPPNHIAKEIGKLEVRFSQASQKIVSKAPPVIHPVKGDDVVQKDPEKMTTAEWMAWDKQKTIERRKQTGAIAL